MHLSGLSPFGPIFGKELRTASRRKRNYLLRIAYLAGLFIFLLLTYQETGGWSGSGGMAARIGQLQELGASFFFTFSFFCLFAMALIGPVVTSTAINGERQAKTLHVLLMTPLSAWQIVSGKLLSRLLTALTLIGLSLPVLALVRLLGGVELTQMFAVLCLCFVTALFAAALGLLFSILNRRAYAVILLAYFLMAILYLIGPMLIIALKLVRSINRGPTIHLFASVNPFFALGMMVSDPRGISDAWIYCTIVHLFATAVLLLICALLVRRLARKEGDGAPSTEANLPSSDFSPAALPPPTNSLAPPAPISIIRKTRDVFDSPVLWRELRRPLMSRRWQRIAITLACLALLGLAYLAAGMNDALRQADFQVILAVIFFTALLLLTCVIAATSIAHEKEGDTWPILLASPLTGRSIIWSKTAGVARRLLWPNLFVAAHFLAFTIAGVIPPFCLLTTLCVMILFNAIWIATGIYFSLRFRKVSVAVMANLAAPVLLYLALPLVLAVIDDMGSAHGDLVRNVFWAMPYFFLTQGLQGITRTHFFYDLPNGSQISDDFTYAIIVLCVGVAHVAIAYFILSHLSRRFNAIVGRTTQRNPLPPDGGLIRPNPLLPVT